MGAADEKLRGNVSHFAAGSYSANALASGFSDLRGEPGGCSRQ